MTSAAPPPLPPEKRRHRWLAAPLFWLIGSSFTHLSAVLLLLIGGSAAASGGGGEGGLRGGGDTNIDISVAGSDGTEIAPPTPVDPTPPSPVPPPPKVPPSDVAPPPLALPDPDSDLSPPAQTRPSHPPTSAGAAVANGGRAPGPVRLGAGLGDGLRGDTVEGQRSLLPAAVSCKDPVEGVWEALKYNPMSSSWVRFTLLVHRSASGIAGSILSHTWFGSPADRTPPVCSIGGFEISVSMKASGRVERGTQISFGASSYTIVLTQCPAPHTDYAPDNFSGTIDTNRQEFQSVNNDGAVDINAPYVFRRTGCIED